MTDISQDKDADLCVLLLSQGNSNLFVMGLPIFMDYYAVHDDAMGRLSFAPTDISDKPEPVRGQQPKRVFKSSEPESRPTSMWSFFVTVTFVLLFFTTMMVFVGEALVNRRDRVEPIFLYAITVFCVIVFAIIMYIFVQPKVNRWFTKSPDEVAKVSASISSNSDMVDDSGIFDGLAVVPYLGALALLVFAFSAEGSRKTPQR